MSAQAIALTEPRLDASPALSFAQVRDDVVRAYQPATAEESLLANQIARAWFRLQKYYDLEADLIEKQCLSEMFETDLARFKALTSAIAAAERMWRQAIAEFQRARRRSHTEMPSQAITDSSDSPQTVRERDEPRHPVPLRRPPSSPTASPRITPADLETVKPVGSKPASIY